MVQYLRGFHFLMEASTGLGLALVIPVYDPCHRDDWWFMTFAPISWGILDMEIPCSFGIWIASGLWSIRAQTRVATYHLQSAAELGHETSQS